VAKGAKPALVQISGQAGEFVGSRKKGGSPELHVTIL
jgi:hypothetical protein